MQKEDILKQKYGTDPGFRVPENYFENLNRQIMENLPAYPEAPRRADLSMWQRVKPYLYLAAMFAGIWLMMNVFHRVSSGPNLSVDNPPEAIVQALESNHPELDYIYSSQSDIILQEEISEDYQSIEEFEEDFYSH